MLEHILTAYRCYLRLRLRSVARMCCTLPMVVKLLFTVVVVAVGYGLVRMEIPHDTAAAGWITAVFVALGMFVCRMGRTELALLDELHVCPTLVFVGRCLLLSVPFFLLDAWAGLWGATVGTAAAVSLSLYRLRRTAADSFTLLRRLRFGGPLAAAYAWIAGYRSEVLWILFAGFALHLIALANNNVDMAGVAMGVMVFAPVLTVYYKRPDPTAFLRIYRSAAYLMRRKATEGCLCAIVPLCWSLPLSIAVFPEHTGWLIGAAGVSFVAAMISLYAAYAFYPHLLTSIVGAGALIVGSMVWLAAVPIGVAVASLAAVLAGLHGLSIYNMKQLV